MFIHKLLIIATVAYAATYRAFREIVTVRVGLLMYANTHVNKTEKTYVFFFLPSESGRIYREISLSSTDTKTSKPPSLWRSVAERKQRK